jgi:peptidyl-prolyl cis-trans isomerase C
MATGQTPAGEPAAVAKNERVVMRVNGEPVTEREFNAFLEQAPEETRAFYNSPQGRPLLAQQLVKLKSLEQEARRLGVANDPEAQVRIKMADEQVMAAFALQKLVNQPNDARVRAEFEKQKAQFQTVDLSHILIAFEGGGVPPRKGHPLLTYDQAMQKAKQIEAQLAKGAPFTDLARQESDDTTSGPTGGQLGPINPAALPPEVQQAVASLKEGQISNPVKSPYGIHIFKAGTKQSQRYEELKPMLGARLQRQDAELLIQNLQNSAKVELDPKFFPPAPPKPPLRGPRKNG